MDDYTLVKNGTIITDTATYKADILIKDGKIECIGVSIPETHCKKVIDATGLYVLPGAIDGHTHLAMPFGGTISADDYEAGTRAAACGGTTTVFDFAIQNTGELLGDTLKRRDALASVQACVDYAFHIAIKDISTKPLLDSVETAVESGVTSFKIFMVYDFFVNDGQFYTILKKTKECGALLGVHAENREIINTLIAEFKEENHMTPYYHYLSRPEFVEEEADQRAIAIAKSTKAPLYIVHLANKGGVKALEEARKEGYPIFAETCIQYLEMTSDVYKRDDAIKYVCSPPMKGKESQAALWDALKRGVISTVATDHCPFQLSEKHWGDKDFTKIPNGCAGVENMFPYMLSKANEGVLPFTKVVEVCCVNPAKLFGLYPQKGALCVGSDADFVLYDPHKAFEVSVKNMHSNVDHTIWEGLKLKGYPKEVYSRGNLVFKEGEFVGKKGDGKRLICKKIKFTGPSLE
ncbi:D-hydantoinase, putative [Entamoeba invadens IP1]|uniref:dihydropyrimidinase n=1 Tax=Entamoeba invadens IP1 TaxID=370355 RepID=A0A0A1UG32_ENTIV|nr:D-hydantoinase, putative [Entamoeba invadens IP1]ELP92189.1 D-hydantoinase, putative [Entamoeba invadens IP1]|eukprot:XP_004258960.1 D-hydantoinase, putative [Entamoeba invadens IP1]